MLEYFVLAQSTLPDISDLIQVGILASALTYALRGVLAKQWTPGWYALKLEQENERLQARCERLQEMLLKGADITARAASITEAAVGTAVQVLKEKQ
jgi:hypothetical protein